ncbi:hypothetical protein L6164_003350 [Bauhinia variegata]|uniref:Uncharacterized protein n=1 Tax=Bauhinia variegata TaxID=167791 RepID=A0ACB9Q3R2_BAUVA|nr:hypothetical protein L6164_003350 [Bauhinia variegata]
MVQQSLIYSFVASGTVILEEYTEFKGNFTGIAAQCLQKLPPSNNKFTYNCDGHTTPSTTSSTMDSMPVAFHERIKDEFTKRYNSLNKEFRFELKEQMQYCVDHPKEISKLTNVKARVSEGKGVMMKNVETVKHCRNAHSFINKLHMQHI